jgi:HD-GYP domain-containing protein (c-di-GMP phosphodiesterase class II)
MKSHTTLGYEELMQAIEKGAPIDEEIAIVALEHHEKFCGGGYPTGKCGRLEEKADGIHYLARIVSIADVYSALLMKRVYKEAFRSKNSFGYHEKMR